MAKSKSRKKKKPSGQQKQLSPANYIVKKARTLPIGICRINSNWKDSGMAHILVSRLHNNNHHTAAMYLVDMLAKGVKDTAYSFNEPEYELKEKLDEMFDDEGFEACDYTLAHNIIYGAIDFAEEYGFEPHKDFRITKYILEKDTEDIPLMDIEFGKDGKPLLFDTGLYDEETEDFDELPENLNKDNVSDFLKDDPEKLFDKIDSMFVKYCEPEYLSDEEIKPFYDADPEIKFEPIEELNRFKSDIEHKAYEEIFKELSKSPSRKKLRKLDEQLRKMIKENPDNPILFHCLVNVHRLMNNNEVAEQLIQECYEKYPDYLFARIEYARLLLHNEELDKIPEIFNNTYLLHKLYPERKQFHISEIINFYAFLCVYYLKIDEFKYAIYFFNIISELSDFEGAELLGLTDVVDNAFTEMAFYKLNKVMEKLHVEDEQNQ